MPNTTSSPPQQPVIVKRIVKIKRKRSLISFLVATIFLLTVFILIGSILSAAIWLHTFKVFTQETVAADLYVSKKVIKDGKPTFTVRYVPHDDVSGFWGILGSNAKSTDAVVETDMIGDQVFVNADFIKWNSWVTMLNVKPVYKINRITPGYQNSLDYERFGVKVTDVNGGPDWVAARLQENQQKFNWFASSVFISSAGINVLPEDAAYKVVVTEDAVTLKRS